jgi:hypothetical protein
MDLAGFWLSEDHHPYASGRPPLPLPAPCTAAPRDSGAPGKGARRSVAAPLWGQVGGSAARKRSGLRRRAFPDPTTTRAPATARCGTRHTRRQRIRTMQRAGARAGPRRSSARTEPSCTPRGSSRRGGSPRRERRCSAGPRPRHDRRAARSAAPPPRERRSAARLGEWEDWAAGSSAACRRSSPGPSARGRTRARPGRGARGARTPPRHESGGRWTGRAATGRMTSKEPCRILLPDEPRDQNDLPVHVSRGPGSPLERKWLPRSVTVPYSGSAVQ